MDGVKIIREKIMLLVSLLVISFGAVLSSEDLQAPVELNGILGDSVTFYPKIPEGYQVMSVTWILVATNKIIVVIRPDGSITVRDGHYQGRVETLNQNYALRINGLRMDDSGLYSVKVYSNMTPLQRDYRLQVFQMVPDPDVKVTSVGDSSKDCRVTLTCAVKEAGEGVVYTWSASEGNKQARAGPILQLSLTANDLRLTYTCKAKNPVSEGSKEIRPFDYCKEHSSFVGAGRGNIQRDILSLIVVGLLISLLVLSE